jgi:predicted metal-dependent HD superfamily phosphohydrolase
MTVESSQANAFRRERWSRLWEAATRKAATTGLFERLLEMYAEPHRHYHNARHIAECLNEFDQAKQLAADSVAVELAIWFHDAVYDSRAGDNEERSAGLASSWLQEAGAPTALVDSLRLLVLATKAHDGTLHPDAPLLVDVDLSILGQRPERFWEYERGIRAEYAWVEQKIYAIKRAEILERFLARPRLYHTASFFTRFEAQARANLRASTERLRRGITS